VKSISCLLLTLFISAASAADGPDHTDLVIVQGQLTDLNAVVTSVQTTVNSISSKADDTNSWLKIQGVCLGALLGYAFFQVYQRAMRSRNFM
jgi:hypothetical protein